MHRPLRAAIAIVEPELDAAVGQGARLAAEIAVSLFVPLAPCRWVGALLHDLSLQQLESTGAAAADVAFVRKTVTGPQGRAHDDIVITAIELNIGALDADRRHL